MDTKYYFPEFDIDGTADELYDQVSYGYVPKIESLNKIVEILENEKKRAEDPTLRHYQLQMVRAEIEYQKLLEEKGSEDCAECIYAVSKFDICRDKVRDIRNRAKGFKVLAVNHSLAGGQYKEGKTEEEMLFFVEDNDSKVISISSISGSENGKAYNQSFRFEKPLDEYIETPVEDLMKIHNESLFYSERMYI